MNLLSLSIEPLPNKESDLLIFDNEKDEDLSAPRN
jgi:hypothetical protein